MNIFVAMLYSQKKLNVHSDNTLVNCNAIFCGCKNGDFQMKKFDGGCSNKYLQYMF